MISIIIPAWTDNGDYLTPYIDSIRTHEPKVEILVIDNASKKPVSPSKDYRLFRREESMSYAAALNYGADNSRGEWLIFSNDDCLCIGSFKKLIHSLDKLTLYGAEIRRKKPAWGADVTVDYVYGWLQVMHRIVYELVGKFDERLTGFGLEDIDYGWRASEYDLPVKAIDLPFKHLETHRRCETKTFTDEMADAKKYFIEKVKRHDTAI